LEGDFDNLFEGDLCNLLLMGDLEDLLLLVLVVDDAG
jgi:hypothetical protein